MSLGLLRSWMNRPASPRHRARPPHKHRVGMELLEERQLLTTSPVAVTLLTDPVLLDFGTSTSPLAPGATRVTLAAHNPIRGFGWESTSGISAVDLQTVDPLTRDFHRGRTGTFLVDVPNGSYEVTAVLGDPTSLMDRVSISAEGVGVAGGLRADPGSPIYATFNVDVTDGQLNLHFADGGGSNPYFALAALNITPLGIDEGEPPALTANAGGDQTVGEGQAITFAGSATGTSILTYLWDFGDGTYFSGTLNPTHYYADNGAYTVTLTVYTWEGETATDTITVTVENLEPWVDPGGPYFTTVGAVVAFDATIGDPSPVDEEAGIPSWWDYGDGSEGPEPYHIYAAPGVYTVTVGVLDKDGAWSWSATTVYVDVDEGEVPPEETPPTEGPLGASAGGDQFSQEGQVVYFNGSASGESALSYWWDFGDGTGVGGTLNPWHAYLNDGVYIVTLTVTDAYGQTVQDSAVVTVANAAPWVSLGGPFSRWVDAPILFTPAVADPSDDDTAAGFSYWWSFGDGTTSALATPTHVYGSPGVYTVTLSVADRDGGVTTVTTTVTVTEPIVTLPPGEILPGGIPNFGANPTITTVRSGNWSDPGVWSLGRLPTAGDIVAITSGRTVNYDLLSDSPLDTVVIQSGGHLQFRTNINTRLTVRNFLVLQGGWLEIGSAANPVAASVKAEVVFPNLAIDLTRDPEQWGHGLIAQGKVTMHGAAKNLTFVRLAVEPRAGHTTLQLSEPVSGWQVGDRLVLPDTRQLDVSTWLDNYVWHGELVTIAAISPNGRTLTLTAPLAYDHLGARTPEGRLDFLPHVMNLTRNVVIRSASPDGVRGHTLFMTGAADVDIRYAGFVGLGRTTNLPLDNTTFGPDGQVTHIGTNQTNRYSVNLRWLWGPPTPQDGGFNYTFVGNSIFCPMQDHHFKWGLVINDSHFGLIQDNVLYNWAGAGIVAELGNESYNVVERNFVVRVRGDFGWPYDWHTSGIHYSAGIWLRGFNNYVRDNVVAEIHDLVGAGIAYYGSQGGYVLIPRMPGAAPDTLIDMNASGILECARNEVYATHVGLSIWWLGDRLGPIPDAPHSVVTDFVVWHQTGEGFFPYQVNNLTLDGMIGRGDVSAVGRGGQNTGVTGSDYIITNFTLRNADIQGMWRGYLITTVSSGTQTVEDSYFNNVVNILVTTPSTNWATAEGIGPRMTIIRNVRFGTVPGMPQITIEMAYTEWGQLSVNLTVSDQVLVYDYNGVAGDDFQLYYREQTPDYIMPLSIANDEGSLTLVGSPEEGLTNEQNWEKYGIAIAGAVAPPDAVEGASLGIRGLVRRF